MKSIIYQGITKKGRNIIIRYPIFEDLQVMTDYINSMSKEKTYITFQGERLTIKAEKKYLQEAMKKIKKGQAVKLLAFHEQKLIGISDIVLQERTSSHVGVLGLTIAKDYRGEGIGKLLMRLIMDEAKKNLLKLRIITLGVFANNPVAYNIYKKFGFVEHGKMPEGVYHRGKYIDHIYMHKKVVVG